MKFDRWFWKDDTDVWSRKATTFLWVITSLVLVLLLIWAVWN